MFASVVVCSLCSVVCLEIDSKHVGTQEWGCHYHIRALSILMIAPISDSLLSHTHEHIQCCDGVLRLGLPCAMLYGVGHENVAIVGRDEIIALLQRTIASITFELNF